MTKVRYRAARAAKNKANTTYSEEIGALAESLKIFQKYKVIIILNFVHWTIVTIVKTR